MPVLNFNVVNTSPGAGDGHPFSPPEGWQGDRQAYMELMRRRFKERPHGMYMAAQARHVAQHGARFEGPYAAEARVILDRLKPKEVFRSTC